MTAKAAPSPALGKTVIFKPIAWNSHGYLGPMGSKGSPKDFVGSHGYGHEEWNGRPDWIWKGWKVFHTEASGKILKYAQQGKLGLIMTVMTGGKFYAVGAACGVLENSAEQRRTIAKALGLHQNGDALWSLPIVREKKAGNRAAFDAHWLDNFEWVRWRCEPTHYHWFEKPIEIVPNEVIPSTPPRKRISTMHGKWQGIRPDQAIASIESGLPAAHPILDWLSTGRFDFLGRDDVSITPTPKGGSGGAPAPSKDPYVRYLRELEIRIDPRHHLLQGQFVKFLEKRKFCNVTENVNFVDVRYVGSGGETILAEVKPCTGADARFAIRAALGQLLDYRQRHGSPTRQLVILGDKPATSDDIDLALHNGFGIGWPRGRAFEIVWPKDGE